MIKKALDLLKESEGCRLKAYADSGGIYTIGYGATYYQNYQKVKAGDTITQEEAEQLLLFHIEEHEKAVKLYTNDFCLPQQCIDAITVLVFNIGITAFAKSTLYKKIKEDKNNLKAIETEWNKWVKCNGKTLPGLVKRRAKEYEIYEAGILSQYTKKEKEQLFPFKCNLK